MVDLLEAAEAFRKSRQTELDLPEILKQSFPVKPKRKRTEKEAKERIESLPDLPNIPLLPPVLKPAPKLISRGAKELAKGLVEIDPLDRLADSSPQPLPITRVSPESFVPLQTTPITNNQETTSITNNQERPTMITREEVIQMLVNDPLLEVTEEMLPIINDPTILMNGNGELVRTQFAQKFRESVATKPKRKVSKYQKELGKQLKMLKKKHPRTKVTALMKRAHKLTRKALSK